MQDSKQDNGLLLHSHKAYNITSFGIVDTSYNDQLSTNDSLGGLNGVQMNSSNGSFLP